MTDRLTLTRALESSGMQSDAAERIATEIYDAIHDNVATKTDLREQRLTLRFEQVERRIDTMVNRMVAAIAGRDDAALRSAALLAAALMSGETKPQDVGG